MGAFGLSQVRCRLVGFSRVASKVTCLPVKPDRVRKYLSGMHYQYTPLYPVSVSVPGGSTTTVLLDTCSNTIIFKALLHSHDTMNIVILMCISRDSSHRKESFGKPMQRSERWPPIHPILCPSQSKIR